MSTWSYMQGQYQKFNQWPDPFKNGVKRFEQVSCQGEQLFDIEMWFPTVGSWFFSSFVPTPTEIARKTVTGGYKCGFYLGLKTKSPLDIIWRNGAGSRFLGRVLRVPITTFYYVWGIQTIWEGLSTWQSLVYKGYECEGDANSCITADGPANISTEGPGNGAMPFGVDVFDPNGWHTGLGGDIHIPGPGNASCRFYCTVTAAGASVDNLCMELVAENFSTQFVSKSQCQTIGNGEQVTYAIDAGAYVPEIAGWGIKLSWDNMTKHIPLGRIELRLSRAIARWTPFDPDSTCALWIPGDPGYHDVLDV